MARVMAPGATISAAMASGFSAVVLWQFADCRVDPALFAVPSLEELLGGFSNSDRDQNSRSEL